MSRSRALIAAASATLVCAPMLLGAQGYRITGVSLATFVELRPVASDSIADSLATGTGLVRESPVGLVRCPEGQTRCYFYRSLDRSYTVPLVQDVEVTGWGLGQGVSVYAHVRAHVNAGGVSQLWTREDDRFNALAAYVEVDRPRWLARAGRQWLTSQLGMTNFDGVALNVRATPRLGLEAYAGSSLIQGLSERGTGGALAAAEVLPPDVGGALFGGVARWRTTDALSMSVEYQREIRNDRAGVVAERVAFDGAYVVGLTSVTAEAQVDLASTAVNELRLRATRPLLPGLSGSVEAMHVTPFFPLWTIWGVFAPVGFNEARADAVWRSANTNVSLALGGGYRRYQDTHTGVGFLPLRDDGWTVVAGGTWRARPAWDLAASYRRDIGFGASKSDGNAGVRWHPTDGAWVGVTGTVLQNIYEFRVANGYLVGGSLEAAVPLRGDLRLSGIVGLYRQIAANTPATTVNWSQRRALIRLEWAVGADPGMRAPTPLPSATPP